MAVACLQYGFSELGFSDVYSFTADVNQPSKNVMVKIGMNEGYLKKSIK
ncbi:GNAT family N-acetyltransferase [Heyndrickxia ginsengihumi]